MAVAFNWLPGEVAGDKSFRIYDSQTGAVTIEGDLTLKGKFIMLTTQVVDFTDIYMQTADKWLRLNVGALPGDITATGIQVDRPGTGEEAAIFYTETAGVGVWHIGTTLTYNNLRGIATENAGGMVYWDSVSKVMQSSSEVILTAAAQIASSIPSHDYYTNAAHKSYVSRTNASDLADVFAVQRRSGGGTVIEDNIQLGWHTEALVLGVSDVSVSSVVSDKALYIGSDLTTDSTAHVILDKAWVVGTINDGAAADTSWLKARKLKSLIEAEGVLKLTADNTVDTPALITLTASTGLVSVNEFDLVNAQKRSYSFPTGYTPLPTGTTPFPLTLTEGIVDTVPTPNVTYHIVGAETSRANEVSHEIKMAWDNSAGTMIPVDTNYTFKLPIYIPDGMAALRSVYGVIRKRTGSLTGTVENVYPISTSSLYVGTSLQIDATYLTTANMVGWNVLYFTVSGVTGYFDAVLTVVQSVA